MFLLFVLAFGLSTVSVLHALEHHEDIHAGHQCTIYESIHHAVLHADTDILILPEPQPVRSFEDKTTLRTASVRPRTRSPPVP
ncbi:DUF2607 domain-containing protein [Grimontia kaedaensis]|uniref:DUF2607 domain-containing protein n=1 Tax=Grimontia kaedaensis TaxID=2872157 RepID=A0ABY4WZL2_9GAMM|nr:DUF2607 domain-containing protein [Grimontia kaedaensis]